MTGAFPGQLGVPCDLPSSQMFQKPVLSEFCPLHWDYTLFNQALQLQKTRKSEVGRARVKSLS